MTYNPAIPQPTDLPSKSQGDMLVNFGALDTEFGYEHNKFSVSPYNGKHKYVTLQQSAVPALPTGTDMVVSQALTISGNPYIQASNSINTYHIPIEIYNSMHVTNGTVTLYDFAANSQMPQLGTVVVWDENNYARTILSPYSYVAGAVEVPGSSPNWDGQLHSGTQFFPFSTSGSKLQLVVSGFGGGGTNLAFKITGSAL